MKKLFTVFCLVLLVPAAWAMHVPRDVAQKVASDFYRLNNPSGIQDASVRSVTVRSFSNLETFYIFRFSHGGFVLVSGDDAVIPILGYSFENEMPAVIDNPATEGWLENYSRQIEYIASHKFDNSETLKAWNSVSGKSLLYSPLDVPALLNTAWDQGCFYNAMCPSAAAGQCGHVWTGCVATAIAQIMKYHNFPPQGVGQHSYTDATYGLQTANFGNTTYDWASMPNNVGGSNPAVATLMYHDGVSVNMQYGVSGSGAFSEAVPVALLNYFNFRPEIEIKYKNDYSNVEDFKNLLRADLDQGLPIYYSGSNPSEGHAFVCDGYRVSDGTFHFNWGWSGSSNGYFAIGNLNPGGTPFNDNNAVVVHIRPYNPDLIVRITNPVNNAIVGVGYSVDLKAKVVRGTATLMKIFIDNIEKFSVAGDSISYTWSTSPADLGSHLVQAFAYYGTDTVYYKINVNVAEWISQASGFPAASRAVTYLSAPDSNVVWGTANDSNTPTGACSDFTRTTDGGNTWIPGTIPNTTGLASAMIFAMDSLKAYVAMYKVNGNKPMGIYLTTDGGQTWTRQTTALFNNVNSFPDVVHFFDTSNGVTIGDPINNVFEIYTTTDGGSNWIIVPGSDIPNPRTGEFGVVGYYSAVHDTIWFGTNMGRVYKSVDKGYTWSVSAATSMSGLYVKPVFRDGMHGLLQDESSGNGALCETSDGGATWTQVNSTGSTFSGDLAYIPGTADTWVRSGSSGNLGCAYSFDGGHTWTDFVGVSGTAYYQMSWINNHCGWAGGVNTNTTQDGVLKFIGNLQIPLPVPRDVQASSVYHDVHVSWLEPDYSSASMTLLGYNINRNGTRLNATPVSTTSFDDPGVPSGMSVYCVTALYNMGESLETCDSVDVAVGTGHPGELNSLTVYPNPSHEKIFIRISGAEPSVHIFNRTGVAMPMELQALSGNLYCVNIKEYPSGLYLVLVTTSEGRLNSKLVVY